MTEESILSQRGPAWRRLEELTAKAGHSFKRLHDDELEEFVRLYRQTSADLAFLMTRSSNDAVVEYLNAIVGRAYSQLYREPYKPWAKRFQDSLYAAADTVRRRHKAVFLAIGIFFAAMVTTSGLLSYSDDFRQFYIPQDPAMRQNFEKWKSGEFDPRTEGESSLATFFYASNNPRVSIVVHAISVLSFGTYSSYLIWQNGSLLGALGHEMAGVGKLGYLVVSIVPHGVTEIGGIFMSGAGAFVLAWALIFPGRRTRAEALRIAGKDAFVLVMLSVVMTLMAAPIEGFFSFDPRIPAPFKALVGVVTLGGWIAFFAGYGRSRQEALVE
ncbi:MAG TPA: stage II sporulation protein M [Fimbriimonadaceae bacterium]|nr:stage II sporulation protein M [Fimbriimonadaceae bacterium]